MSALRRRTIPCLDLLDSRAARPVPRPPAAPPAGANPLLGLLGCDAGGDPLELVRGLAAAVVAALPTRINHRRRFLDLGQERRKSPTQAERDVRRFLARAVTGRDIGELAAEEDPPISRSTASRSIRQGEELVRLAAPRIDRFNPDRPAPRAERRRGASPEW